MSFHSGPEGQAPDDQRCEALVKGHPSWFYEWANADHRCPKRANQMRGDHAVCHLHAKAKTLTAWKEKK